MKKILLTTTAIALLSAGMMAQNRKIGSEVGKPVPSSANSSNRTRCATPPPSQQWDADFNKMVELYKQNLQTGRTTTAATYSIQVVFHIIHSNTEGVNTGHN